MMLPEENSEDHQSHCNVLHKIFSPMDILTLSSREISAVAAKKIKNPFSSVGMADKINPGCHCRSQISFLVEVNLNKHIVVLQDYTKQPFRTNYFLFL